MGGGVLRREGSSRKSIYKSDRFIKEVRRGSRSSRRGFRFWEIEDRASCWVTMERVSVIRRGSVSNTAMKFKFRSFYGFYAKKKPFLFN